MSNVGLTALGIAHTVARQSLDKGRTANAHAAACDPVAPPGVTLKLVAQYGDASNFSGDSATIRHKLEVLRGHCENVGRNYNEIVKSSQIRIHQIDKGDDPETASAPYRGNHSTSERDAGRDHRPGSDGN